MAGAPPLLLLSCCATYFLAFVTAEQTSPSASDKSTFSQLQTLIHNLGDNSINSYDDDREVIGDEEKRAEFSPWGGKRGFQPWGGKRSGNDEASRVLDDDADQEVVAKRQWRSRESEYIRALIKKGFNPWGGKRASFQPWGGKRSVDMDTDNALEKRTVDREEQDAGYKRGFQPWGGKRAFQPWGGKRTFDPWGGKRGFQPWGGKRAFNPWGGKRAFQPWGGKRSAEMLLNDLDQSLST